MAQQTKVTRTTVRRDDDIQDDESTTTHTTQSATQDAPSGSVIAARIAYYILGVILVILTFRFLLALFGANPGNGFTQFIFELSRPLVEPFFGLFRYEPDYGVGRFEIFTLVAMGVYTVIAWGIVALIRLPRGGDEV